MKAFCKHGVVVDVVTGQACLLCTVNAPSDLEKVKQAEGYDYTPPQNKVNTCQHRAELGKEGLCVRCEVKGRPEPEKPGKKPDLDVRWDANDTRPGWEEVCVDIRDERIIGRVERTAVNTHWFAYVYMIGKPAFYLGTYTSQQAAKRAAEKWLQQQPED